MTDIKTYTQRLLSPPQNVNFSRRYDLDCLRVLAFALLIFFHVGMFYTANWGWHVKSSYRSEFLESIMLIVEPWRMPVLWLIAGIAIRFVLAKVGLWHFVSRRSLRLLLPLLFGVLVIVPPQLYAEMTYNGDLNMSFWQFMGEFYTLDSGVFEKYQSGIWPHIDVNHLWFIRSLWQFSLLICLLIPLLNSSFVARIVDWVVGHKGAVAIGIATLPILFIQLGENSDSTRDQIGFLFIVYGYLLAWNDLFWQKIKSHFKQLLISCLVCLVVLISVYTLFWGDDISTSIKLSGLFVYSLARVLGVLTLLSFASRYLNKNCKVLNYLNEAVYPFYILHQTIIIVIGFNISGLQLGPVIEPILIILGTTVSCFIGFEIIRRIELLRPLFGLKMKSSYSMPIKRLGYAAAALLIAPIGWEVLV